MRWIGVIMFDILKNIDNRTNFICLPMLFHWMRLNCVPISFVFKKAAGWDQVIDEHFTQWHMARCLNLL